MASNMYATECPQCGRSAIVDEYYKRGDRYLTCWRCGYCHTVENRAFHEKDGVGFEEEVCPGFGVFVWRGKKDGYQITMLGKFDEALEREYMEKFHEEGTDQETSYFVRYDEGRFKVLAGKPTENFHLPFDVYRDKMYKEYDCVTEFERYLVPIEE
ncbi:hypothetical protein [Indiicoccus explosivorum]|uniref:hypothetical protein n=1 Tax=Indiicoccus explosivorum TaxID=1917864 RepID=UPI000B442AF7|nr:hypothetical protein [Indiicoccus explosivorum]